MTQNTLEENILYAGEDFIISFDERILRGDEFSLIRLSKYIEETKVSISEDARVTIDELPLMIEVGISENLLKVTPVEEYIPGEKYSLFIPKESLMDEALNTISSDLNFEFVIYDPKGNPVISEYKNIDDDKTLDSSFSVSSFNEGAMMVWVNYNEELTNLKNYEDSEIGLENKDDVLIVEEGEIRNYIKHADINVAIYDELNDTWNKTVVTENLTRDYNPKVMT